VTVPEALIVAVPAVFELTITVHLPSAPVGPVGPHVPPVIEPTPEVFVDVIATPAAGVQPVPSLRSTKTVNVCGLPTTFVALGPIVIRASTHVFWLPMSWAP
jgi:hypothetical protein